MNLNSKFMRSKRKFDNGCDLERHEIEHLFDLVKVYEENLISAYIEVEKYERKFGELNG